jgi:hypothetical protein
MALWWSRSNWGAGLLARRLVRPVSAVTASGVPLPELTRLDHARVRTVNALASVFSAVPHRLATGCVMPAEWRAQRAGWGRSLSKSA